MRDRGSLTTQLSVVRTLMVLTFGLVIASRSERVGGGTAWLGRGSPRSRRRHKPLQLIFRSFCMGPSIAQLIEGSIPHRT